MDKLYTVNHQLLKNQRQLKEVAASLESQILRIGKILSTRWVASSKRTVDAVLKSYPALVGHFKRAAVDVSRDDTERKKYNGLLRMITSEGFILNVNVCQMR